MVKIGGRFLRLELSLVDVPGLDRFYDLYFFNVIPAGCRDLHLSRRSAAAQYHKTGLEDIRHDLHRMFACGNNPRLIFSFLGDHRLSSVLFTIVCCDAVMRRVEKFLDIIANYLV